MSERFESDLERELASSLEPVRAPESLWYGVDAELTPRPARARPLPRMALVFGLFLVAMVSVGWYFRPLPYGGYPAAPSTPSGRSQHACVVCHS